MTRIVTGNLIYKTAYNYNPNERVTIKYLGKAFQIGIDEINNDFVENMLLSIGIKKLISSLPEDMDPLIMM